MEREEINKYQRINAKIEDKDKKQIQIKVCKSNHILVESKY